MVVATHVETQIYGLEMNMMEAHSIQKVEAGLNLEQLKISQTEAFP